MPQVPSKLVWLRHRLAAMSPAEIAHRVGEQAKRKAARARPPRLPEITDGPLPCLPGFVAGVRRLAADHPDLATAWRAHAQAVRAGRITLLGQSWPEEAEAETQAQAQAHAVWHLDPVTGGYWPQDRYCFDIDYRHQGALGDVKYVWERNRLQYLHPVAALAILDGDAPTRDYLRGQLLGWQRANPAYRGINWASGIELALRLVSFFLVLSALDGAAFTPDARTALRRSLAEHAVWLARYPSLYSSANNHYIAELAGLYLYGRLCPDLPHAAAFAARAKAALFAETGKQIHNDGVGAEQSPTYSALTLEWLLLCVQVGRATDDAFPAATLARLAAAGAALRVLFDANGQHPRIGDDDDSSVIRSGDGAEPFARSISHAIAAVSATPALAPPVAAPHLRDALFGPLPPPRAPEPGLSVLPQGGLSVVRETWRGVEALWLLDHGPLGYLSIAAHGHADPLSLWLHLAGRPYLVDAGTYRYHGAGEWRDLFRSTAWHNTLCLDDANAATITGPFNWGARYKAQLIEHAAADDLSTWHLTAAHDGYRKAFGLVHRRTVARAADGDTVCVSDRLDGDGAARPTAITWLVHPSLRLQQYGAAWHIAPEDGAGPVMLLDGEGPLSVVAEEAWYSPSFGVKQPCPRLRFVGTLDAGTAQITRFRLA